MARKTGEILIVLFIVFTIASVLYAWTNCPPGSLISNPKPIVAGGTDDCLIKADWVELSLNEEWSKKVNLQGGQSYWFSASKCARGRTLYGEIRNPQGKIVKTQSSSTLGFCFRAEETGSYTVTYKVASLNGSYSFAITNGCLSKSNCR